MAQRFHQSRCSPSQYPSYQASGYRQRPAKWPTQPCFSGNGKTPSLVFPCGLIVQPPTVFRLAAAVVPSLLVLLAFGGIERRNFQEPLSAQRRTPDTRNPEDISLARE